MDSEVGFFDQGEVTVSLTARSKAGRYFPEHEIKRIVSEFDGIDGALFWNPRQELHVLRTERTTTHAGKVCLLLDISDDGVFVVNQTCDHYEWGQLDHIQPPIEVGDFDG